MMNILLWLVGPEFNQLRHPLLLEDSAQSRDQLIQKNLSFWNNRFIINLKYFMYLYLLVILERINSSILFYALHRSKTPKENILELHVTITQLPLWIHLQHCRLHKYDFWSDCKLLHRYWYPILQPSSWPVPV